MMSCAVEDDAIWIADVDYEISDDDCRVVQKSDPRHLCKRQFDPEGFDDDQHVVDMDELFNAFADAISQLGRPVHHAAFSTFGNVDVATGNFFFRPINRSDAKAVPFCAPQHLEKLTGISKENVIVANDATAAAFGEWAYGVGRGTADFGYVWAGRGVNAGLILDRQPWRGRLHPEAGHVLVRRHDSEPTFGGVCPDHNGCMFGLAGFRAIKQRMHGNALSLEEVSDLMGYYYAQLCLDVSLLVAPERIALGGLLMERYPLPGLLENTRKHFTDIKGSYPAYPIQAKESFIVAAETSYAGLCGLVEMTRRKLSPSASDKARP